MAFSFTTSFSMASSYPKYGLDKNRWDTNIAAQASHFIPWKLISQGYTTIQSLLSLKVDNDSRFNFWEGHWVGDTPFILAFPHLYHLSSLHNSPIQDFYSAQDTTCSVDFHFFRNLNDRVSELVGLLGILDSVLLSSSPNKRLWSLDLPRVFTCISYFQFLTHSLTITSFLLNKCIWKSKAPSKVKFFIWTIVLNKINTNDMLQVQRPYTAISPGVCIMCGTSSESVPPLFLHYHVADSLCNTLFGIFGECWVCPATLDQFLLTRFLGFGNNKEAKSLWEYSVYATICSIWLERNSITFNNKFSDKHFVG